MDNDAAASLRMLTAFFGAVVGCVGSLVGALQTDVTFTAIAATGTVVCFCIWFRDLSVLE